MTGEWAGRVFSRESNRLRDADAVEEGGRPHPARRHRETRRSPARSETPSMSRHTSRENRESPCLPVADGAHPLELPPRADAMSGRRGGNLLRRVSQLIGNEGNP